MSAIPYPSKWPAPNPSRPDALYSRITEQQKADLYSRRITTRDLAKTLNVHEKHLSTCFPGKIPIPDTEALKAARKEYKLEIARLVLTGRYTIREAADQIHAAYNTMQRLVSKAKALHPELAQAYPNIVQEQRRRYARSR